MVRSEQHGLTRRQDGRGWRGRGSAGRSGLLTLAIVASLVAVLIVAATGCGSDSETSASTSSTAMAGQNGPSGSVPAGFPGDTRPSGRPGQNTSSSDSTITTTAATEATTTTTEAATASTSLADGQYGDGIYKAGTDIDSDLYKGTVVGGTGHWEITSDASGVKYVASGDPTGSFYVKITSGQYLRLTGVVIEEASSEATDPLATTNLKDGTYRVGYDIEDGWYTGTVTGASTIGYWQISSDANGQKLKASDYPRGAFTFKVTSGQYLTLRGVTVSSQE